MGIHTLIAIFVLVGTLLLIAAVVRYRREELRRKVAALYARARDYEHRLEHSDDYGQKIELAGRVIEQLRAVQGLEPGGPSLALVITQAEQRRERLRAASVIERAEDLAANADEDSVDLERAKMMLQNAIVAKEGDVSLLGEALAKIGAPKRDNTASDPGVGRHPPPSPSTAAPARGGTED